ncbi:hypothetical protein AB0N17_03215 [Streptomyces sp. NPDC051133]|uniref:hypothetical protein n=1 Tax=Streptomyces sp. NPDC051133 TaxID=3155521 RepID=UPI00343C0F9B
MNAEQWNERFPVGTPVLAYPGARPEHDPSAEPLITRTRSHAQLIGGHTDVIWVDGHGAYITLTHVDPITEEQWAQAQVDREATTAARRAALLDAIRTRPQGGWKPERAAFAMKRAGFGWVSERTASTDLEALVAEGHLTPVTEVVIRHYDLTEASR